MKTNAIVRIILYSLLILVLLAILLAGIGIKMYSFITSSGAEGNSTSGSASAQDVQKLDIDWAAGSVTIISDNTDSITFSESGYENDKYSMVYSIQNHTLSIEYAKSSLYFGVQSLPEKDLIITVPEGWFCELLEIDGAALDIQIDDLSADVVSLDGAAVEFDYTGSFNTLECDGAACKMNIVCLAPPYEISLDGAACELNLTFAHNYGFLVQTDGLGCSFNSNVPFTSMNGDYSYGDRQCQIEVDGMGCQINIVVDGLGETTPTIPAN